MIKRGENFMERAGATEEKGRKGERKGERGLDLKGQ